MESQNAVIPQMVIYLNYIEHKAAIYISATLCLNGTLPCVDFMDVILGDIPKPHRSAHPSLRSSLYHLSHHNGFMG